MKSIYDKNEWDIRVTLADVRSGTWNGYLGRDRRIVLKINLLETHYKPAKCVQLAYDRVCVRYL
jgi:hypothetical protein